MQSITRFFILFISLIVLTGCQFTEKINLNDNGSGTYKLKIDMSAMMSSMKGMKEASEDKEEPEVVDTIINFSDILNERKDSIAKLPEDEQAKLKALEDLKLHVSINEEKNIAVTEFIFDFNNISELKNIQEKIEKANSVNDGKPAKENIRPTEVVYHFDGKTFHREVVKRNLTDEQKEAYKKSMEQGSQMVEGSSYQIEYNFPRPVKSTTYKGATFSSDRKTMFIQSDMKKVTEDPKSLDFKVVLE
jgi:hypothetical protein